MMFKVSPQRIIVQCCVCALLALLHCGVAFGQQDTSTDPLKKPELWSRLKDNPADMELWASYVGKKWATMSPAEQQRTMQWKQQLMLQIISDKEAIITSVGRKIDEKQVRLSELENKQLAQVSEVIATDREELRELKANINENFVILEDLYSQIFSELGAEYKYYLEAHPNDAYSKVRWVEEQEAKIKLLKEAKIKQLKKGYAMN